MSVDDRYAVKAVNWSIPPNIVTSQSFGKKGNIRERYIPDVVKEVERHQQCISDWGIYKIHWNDNRKKHIL